MVPTLASVYSWSTMGIRQTGEARAGGAASMHHGGGDVTKLGARETFDTVFFHHPFSPHLMYTINNDNDAGQSGK